ncbi:cupredoxin domain-containing protein [Candidatus Daviesbacteria bacterium]|nr:cupredoxin domain-containing protein [Candidatus Daviesbacteria bacterium]
MTENGSYNKRPLWQWVLIYGIIGLVIYGLIYYFVLANKERSSKDSSVVIPLATNFSAGPSATESAQIRIILAVDGFSPKDLTIKIGTKVLWTNKSGSAATVDSSPHPSHTDYPQLNLGNFADGETLSLIFDKAGTYKYHNHLNSSQFGTIVVQ